MTLLQGLLLRRSTCPRPLRRIQMGNIPGGLSILEAITLPGSNWKNCRSPRRRCRSRRIFLGHGGLDFRVSGPVKQRPCHIAQRLLPRYIPSPTGCIVPMGTDSHLGGYDGPVPSQPSSPDQYEDNLGRDSLQSASENYRPCRSRQDSSRSRSPLRMRQHVGEPRSTETSFAGC